MNPEPDLEHRLRSLAPRVLGATARRFRDFGLAEDATQEALVDAAVQWPKDGIPASPYAWLVRAAHRRMVDILRSEAARSRRETIVAVAADAASAEIDDDERRRNEDVLGLLFMCVHPSLSTASAIALTLRAVGGLTTAEIAAAFLVPESTMAQRISRAKATIRASGVPFKPVEPSQTPPLDAVLHVLYLMFNEGYTASAGSSLQRADLAREAIRITRNLRNALPNDPDVAGLLALMLLTDARRDARSGAHGELITLDEQDRSRWDREQITEGAALVEEALTRGGPRFYSVQAAIAALHDEAPAAAATDWPQICALYDALRKIAPSSTVELNRAVAVAMVEGPDRGLAILDALSNDRSLASHHRLPAVRGHLLTMRGDHVAAAAAFAQAAKLTHSTPERDYLLLKAARLGPMSS